MNADTPCPKCGRISCESAEYVDWPQIAPGVHTLGLHNAEKFRRNPGEQKAIRARVRFAHTECAIAGMANGIDLKGDGTAAKLLHRHLAFYSSSELQERNFDLYDSAEVVRLIVEHFDLETGRLK